MPIYVVGLDKKPVSITTNSSDELVLSSDPDIKVESDSNYIVYSWYMTIHVYDVQPDGVIEYDPNNGTVRLCQVMNQQKLLRSFLKEGVPEESSDNPIDKKSEDIKKSPKTGDDGNVSLWNRFACLGAILISYSAVWLYYHKKKRK